MPDIDSEQERDRMMTEFSEGLLADLKSATLSPPSSRPRILIGEEEIVEFRRRVDNTPGFKDSIVAQAQGADENEDLFGSKREIPYLCQPAVRALAQGAFVAEDAKFADKTLEGIEVMFSWPAEEWVARPHRPMRCDHAMLNVASTIGIALDFCHGFWSPEVAKSISDRINAYTVGVFLETWEKQDAHWSSPDYHWNWKIMCCGEMGTAALSCAESIEQMDQVMEASLAGCLDILDFVPPEGDWAEGAGYWLGTLGHGLKFGLALKRATNGSVDLFTHPAMEITGDFIVHVTEPDGQVYNFNDNAIILGGALDHLLLLANLKQRGDWARTARASDHQTVERLAWEDPSLESSLPKDTARSFPTTGVVTMRSGWDENATFVGLKSANSDVGHSQLDANSFVISTRGERLLIDEGIWPYGHLLGFFDSGGGKRFNFDANGTIGHNTLMVDGEGQVFGAEYPGRIKEFVAGDDVDIAVGDAKLAYGGKLTKYLRTLAFVKPDVLLVYDQVSANEPRLLEWLFHHRADVDGDEKVTRLKQNGIDLTLTRLIPDEAECWRVSDVKRTSAYTESNAHQHNRMSVEYRSFGPFHQCNEIEVLWGIYVGEGEAPVYTVNQDDVSLNVEIVLEESEKTVALKR